MLDKVKAALRITTNAFDSDLNQLIDAGLADLGIAGINAPESDPLIVRAVCTYCAMNRISIDPQQRDWLKRSYDEQKAQMQVANGYGW